MIFRLALCGVTLVCALAAACSPDYVYLRPGTVEVEVRRDYVECTIGQQVQFSLGDSQDTAMPASVSTSQCMENKGYRVSVVEPSVDSARFFGLP